MKFVYDGTKYAVEFSRKVKSVFIRDKFAKNVRHNVKSLYPYTTATLAIVEEGVAPSLWKPWKSAEVGCLFCTNDPKQSDKYSHEEGRVRALRKLTGLVPDEMKPLIWEAYLSRKPKRVKQMKQMNTVEKIIDVIPVTTTEEGVQ